MKLVDLFIAALAFFAVFANAALAADIKYNAKLPVTATQRGDVANAINPGLTLAA